MIQLHAIPAFQDNYIWLLQQGQKAVLIDPGDAEPCHAFLAQHGLSLSAILVTHHHSDHIGGVASLREQWSCEVFGPAHQQMPTPFTMCEDGNHLQVLGLDFEVLALPGHTLDHISFFCPHVGDQAPLLFCGDTLFSAGCGRLFEGSPQQMHASLMRLMALPDDCRVCFAHEYTLSNLRFAQAVEPQNAAIEQHQGWCEAQRAENRATLPTTLAREREINPFLRCDIDAVAAAAARKAGLPTDAKQDPVAVFATLRQWKNTF